MFTARKNLEILRKLLSHGGNEVIKETMIDPIIKEIYDKIDEYSSCVELFLKYVNSFIQPSHSSLPLPYFTIVAEGAA